MKNVKAIFCYLILFSILIFGFPPTEIVKGKGSTVVETVGHEINTELTLADLDWQSCYFDRDLTLAFNPLSSGAYSFDQNDTSIHVREETSTYTYGVGAYTSFSVTNNVISLSFEAKVKSGHQDAINLLLVVYDNQTKMLIKLVPLMAPGYEYCYHTSGVESPLVPFNCTFVLDETSEVTLLFYYEDATSTVWNQEFWISNLVLRTDIPKSSLLSEQTTQFFPSPRALPRGLIWKDGYLFSGTYPPHSVTKINPTNGTKIEDYTTVESCGLTYDGTNYWTSYSSPGRNYISKYDGSFTHLGSLTLPFTDISGLSNDGTDLWVTNFDTDLIYKINKNTGSIISSIPAPSTSSRGIQYHDGYLWLADSDTHQFFKISPADGTISETYSSDFECLFGITIDDQGFVWLSSMASNLIIKTSINANPDFDSPLITPSADLECEIDTSGNYISWILEDDNPDSYEIYREGTKIYGPTSWINGENISINVDLLPIGTYNYTLIAKDLYEHEASSTIWVTVIDAEETSLGWLVVGSLFIIPVILRFYRRKER